MSSGRHPAEQAQGACTWPGSRATGHDWAWRRCVPMTRARCDSGWAPGCNGRRFLAQARGSGWGNVVVARKSANRHCARWSWGSWSKLRRQASLPLPRFRGCDVVWEGGGGSSSAWSCGEDGAVEGSAGSGQGRERSGQKNTLFPIDKILILKIAILKNENK